MTVNNPILIILKTLIGLVLLSLLILWINGIINDVYQYKFMHHIEMTFAKGIKAIFISNNFIKPYLLLIAILGFFIRKAFGWICICILFYFLAFELFFIQFPRYSYDWEYYFFILIPLSIIGVMNTYQIRNNYKIINKLTIILNMSSIIIALILTFIKGYIHLHYNNSIWDIIEKIR